MNAREMDATAPRSIGWPIGRRRHTASPRRRNLRWRLLLISAILVGVVPFWLVSLAASNTHTVSTAFAFTGSPGSYVVPADVCRLRIEAIGAAGGEGGTAGTPGPGAQATALFVVTPGETLVVRVGGEGGAAAGLMPGDGGWNGGGAGGKAFDGDDGRPGQAGSGGGGVTDIRRGGTGLDDRILVAGGGSGGAGSGIGGPIGTAGGDGGDLTGQDGSAALGSVNPQREATAAARPQAATPARTPPISRSPRQPALSEPEATAPQVAPAAAGAAEAASTAAEAAAPPAADSAAARAAAAPDTDRQTRRSVLASGAATATDEQPSATTRPPITAPPLRTPRRGRGLTRRGKPNAKHWKRTA